MNRILSFFVVSMSLAAAAGAQDLIHSAPPQTRPIGVRNATIHTVSHGVIERGVVWFMGGQILAVLPEGADMAWSDIDPIDIDAEGLHIYPGMIVANTLTGLVEINAVNATRDFAETGDVTPEVRAAPAINPDSTIIPVTRSAGILTAGVFPSSGVIPGRASVIRMDGWTWEDMTISDNAGLVINWPVVRPVTAWWMQRSEEEQLEEAKQNLAKIEDAFRSAEAYFEARKADAGVRESIRWEAMRPAIEGSSPVFIRAQELEQIQSAVSWASGRGLKTVIVGGRDAHLCLDLLKRHDVAVMVTGTHSLPRRRDSHYDEPFRLPAVLEEAGVRWCMASGGGAFQAPHERNMLHQTATAVAHGLDMDVAIRSLTLSAAELLGVSDSIGSIERGKQATFIITDGNPLDIRTNVEMAFIDGRMIDLANKQSKLSEKYREKYRQLGLIEEER